LDSLASKHAYQLLAGLGADAGGGGGEVGAAEELVPARCGERRDEVVEPQKLSCAIYCKGIKHIIAIHPKKERKTHTWTLNMDAWHGCLLQELWHE